MAACIIYVVVYPGWHTVSCILFLQSKYLVLFPIVCHISQASETGLKSNFTHAWVLLLIHIKAQYPVLGAIPGVESDGAGAGKKAKELDESDLIGFV